MDPINRNRAFFWPDLSPFIYFNLGAALKRNNNLRHLNAGVFMAPRIVCLGIESTAHTIGAGIVDEKCGILANEKHMHTTAKGGLIPRELADHHARHLPEILRSALLNSGIGWSDIDCIAYSAGPRIGTAMGVGATAARMISLLHNKPIIPVNHSVAHIEIAKKMCNSADPIVLYVSGGNTQIIAYEAGKYRVYGETLDIGIGNLLDSFGRGLGMGFPAGPEIDRLYFEAKGFVELPYSVKGMDLNFSGLLTAAQKRIGKSGNEDLAYSLCHTAFAMVTECCERALAHSGKKELLVTGGVAASRALQEMLAKMCSGRKVELKVCPKEHSQDNGAMIAWTGLLMYKAGRAVNVEKAITEQHFRTDQEKIDWV